MNSIDDVDFYLIDLKSRFDKIQPNTYYLSYSGKVHCVDIGGRLCLFRSDGKTFVAYNCVGCPYGSWKHDTEKELALMNPNQKKYVCELFKESYDVLGIDYKGGGVEQ